MPPLRLALLRSAAAPGQASGLPGGYWVTRRTAPTRPMDSMLADDTDHCEALAFVASMPTSSVRLALFDHAARAAGGRASSSEQNA